MDGGESRSWRGGINVTEEEEKGDGADARTHWHPYATGTYDSQQKRVAEEIAETMKKGV